MQPKTSKMRIAAAQPRNRTIDWKISEPSEVLRRLTRGERVAGIARDLFVSQSTVRNHLSAIYRRLGVHSQSELLARLMPPIEAVSEYQLAGLRGPSRP